MNKTLVSWSTGKDSAWLVHVLRQRGLQGDYAAPSPDRVVTAAAPGGGRAARG